LSNNIALNLRARNRHPQGQPFKSGQVHQICMGQQLCELGWPSHPSEVVGFGDGVCGVQSQAQGSCKKARNGRRSGQEQRIGGETEIQQ
jgi:hypothetical protein